MIFAVSTFSATIPPTQENNIGDLITMIGIGLTFLVGFINIVLSIRKSSLEGVTTNRVKWIGEIKSYATAIVAYSYFDLKTEDDIKTANDALITNAHLLNLNLNILGPFDLVIAEYLKKVVDNRKQDLDGAKEDEFIKYKRLLNLSLQIYLKVEWNRVKKSYRVWPCSIHCEKRSIMRIIKGFGSGDNNIATIKNDYEKFLNFKKSKNLQSKPFSEFISTKVYSSVSVTSHVNLSSTNEPIDGAN